MEFFYPFTRHGGMPEAADGDEEPDASCGEQERKGRLQHPQQQHPEQPRQLSQQSFPNFFLTTAAADALRSRIRGELQNLRLWLLAHQGWKELNGKLVPREETGSGLGGRKPLDLRGLYEYMRSHLELFLNFLDFFYESQGYVLTPAAIELQKAKREAEASDPPSWTGRSEPANAAKHVQKTTHRIADENHIETKVPAARQWKIIAASASVPRLATKEETHAATAGQCRGGAKAWTPAQSATKPDQDSQEALLCLGDSIPSALGVRLEDIAADSELEEYFNIVSNAWSQFYRRLIHADRRIGQRQKFYFKYGKTAAELVYFDTMLAFLKWLLDPVGHPKRKRDKDKAATPEEGETLVVPAEELLERRNLILDHLHEVKAAGFCDKIREAMARRMPAPPAIRPDRPVVEEDGKGRSTAEAEPAPHSTVPAARPKAKKSASVRSSDTGADSTKAGRHPSVPPARKAKAAAVPACPARARATAKRMRPRPAAAAASSAEGAAFVQTCLGSERFFKKRMPGSRGQAGLEAPVALLNHARNLEIPTVQEVRSIVSSLVSSHVDEQKTLEGRYDLLFPAWVDDLLAGFNLLLYGVGSKRAVLGRFAEQLRKEGTVVVVDGMDPRSGRASRLSELAAELGHGPARGVEDVSSGGWAGVEASWAMAMAENGTADTLDGLHLPSTTALPDAAGGPERTGSGASLPNGRNKVPARACTLRSAQHQQGNPEVPLFFVIHNLDCRSMWPHKSGSVMVETLVELVSRPDVHFVASVDHLNAPLLFSTQHLEALSLVWHDVTTLAPYMTELADHTREHRGALSLVSAGEGLKYLLQCVTRRHLELLQLLATRQLEEGYEKEAQSRVDVKRRRKEASGRGGRGQLGDGRASGEMDGGAAGAAASEGGITFEELAEQCAAKMISRSHGNLRQLFDELLDHRLLKSKGMGIKTRYWIPRSSAELRMIVNYRGK